MPTVGALLAAVERRLEVRLPRDEAKGEARLLVAHCTGIDRLTQRLRPELALDERVHTAALQLAAQRAAGAPMAYLVGSREFWGLPFSVGPGVLVPRPDSETLIEAALAHLPQNQTARILDLGTGSGCLLLAILHERPEAKGLGIDQSAEALAYAERNARALGLDGRATFRLGDWWDGVEGCFDLVLSNPPYIVRAVIDGLMPEVRDHEPRAALDGGTDGLDAYRRLFRGLAAHLAPGGLALFELGFDQGPTLLAMAAAHGFSGCSLRQDLTGHDRCLVIPGADAPTVI
ncbi:MAG: peptide chain release factor N(5)-glutamine methyltransferase [Geminicoccaceae bacterium]|nr:MAG: peptide chain release factor N(5)-glutamine methyltransferase [Geminicoccaceae bacterium]